MHFFCCWDVCFGTRTLKPSRTTSRVVWSSSHVALIRPPSGWLKAKLGVQQVTTSDYHLTVCNYHNPYLLITVTIFQKQQLLIYIYMMSTSDYLIMWGGSTSKIVFSIILDFYSMRTSSYLIYWNKLREVLKSYSMPTGKMILPWKPITTSSFP